MVVSNDRKSGTIRVHLIQEKGVNAYAIKRIGLAICMSKTIYNVHMVIRMSKQYSPMHTYDLYVRTVIPFMPF